MKVKSIKSIKICVVRTLGYITLQGRRQDFRRGGGVPRGGEGVPRGGGGGEIRQRS